MPISGEHSLVKLRRLPVFDAKRWSISTSCLSRSSLACTMGAPLGARAFQATVLPMHPATSIWVMHTSGRTHFALRGCPRVAEGQLWRKVARPAGP